MRWIKDKALWILGAIGGIFYLLWRSAQSDAHRDKVKASRSEAALEAEKAKADLKTTETEAKRAEKLRKDLVDAFRSSDPDGE